MKIAKDTVVGLEYRLTLEDGSVVDESAPNAPLVYLHGHGNIVPGLEQALTGMDVGEAKKVDVAPADGYGVHDPEGVHQVPRDRFPDNVELKVGAVLSAKTAEGEDLPFVVKKLQGDQVTVDFNHPLAGQTLKFDVVVRSVRAATAEELQHGHVHGEGGHGH